jgi:hypothetical protein
MGGDRGVPRPPARRRRPRLNGFRAVEPEPATVASPAAVALAPPRPLGRARPSAPGRGNAGARRCPRRVRRSTTAAAACMFGCGRSDSPDRRASECCSDMRRIVALKSSSWTSSASSIHASTCSGVGSSGSSGAAERIRAANPGSMSRPSNVSSRKSATMRLRSSSESCASLCIFWISFGSLPRWATACITAFCTRRTRICASSAAAWALATSGRLTSRSSTRRIVARSSPRSRSVRTSPSRASAFWPYSR